MVACELPESAGDASAGVVIGDGVRVPVIGTWSNGLFSR